MSDTQSSACEPWKFWASTGWTAAAIAAWVAVQFAVFIGVLFYLGVGDDASGEIEKLATHSVVVSLIAIAAAPAEIGVVALAIRFARCKFADYVALVWPSRAHILLGLAVIAVLIPLGDLASWMSGRDIVPPFVVDLYRSARTSGTMWLLVIALAVAAPVTEEIVFRGFMYRGLAASKVGVLGAIVIPSVIWAAMHLQYELFHIVQIFLLGIVFGTLRWRSGSTSLTILLHAIVNLSSLLQTAWFVGKV